MPEGWMVSSRDGGPITDPSRSAEGLLLPIGGYKGSGLAMVLGLLAGTLNGASFGCDVVDFNADERASATPATSSSRSTSPAFCHWQASPPRSTGIWAICARLAHAARLRRRAAPRRGTPPPPDEEHGPYKRVLFRPKIKRDG
jgi:Malate/L-lactate dehydrogenase